MASTYSTNLALELIGTGDQSGTWGTTTNTNLGTLIEQAISGYVTQAITDGADTTITIPNGATGVARNMYLELGGVGGALAPGLDPGHAVAADGVAPIVDVGVVIGRHKG